MPFRDQKLAIMLFGGDGTHGFARKKSTDYKKEKQSPFLTKFLRQSQSSAHEPEPKKAKIIPFMLTPHRLIQLNKNSFRF